MANIFLSYASEDREQIQLLALELEELGFSVWWDTKMTVGSSFDRELERELDQASCVIVVWSQSSVDSEWVREEASEGLTRNILIPVRIGSCRPPLGFRRLHTAEIGSRSPLLPEDVIRQVRCLIGTSPTPETEPRTQPTSGEVSISVHSSTLQNDGELPAIFNEESPGCYRK